MKLMTTITLLAFLLLPYPAFAEIKTITHTVQQPFGGSQSPDDARTAGIARAKREALEQFGTYIESTTIVKDSAVDSDEILALTAGVTKADVVKQKNYTDGDGFGLEITVKVELDTSVLDKSLKRLLEDRNHLKGLKDANEREKKLLARIAELEKENLQKGKSEQQAGILKNKFKAASQGLTAVEWFKKATYLNSDQKKSEQNKKIEYLSQAIRLDPNYALAHIVRGLAYEKLNHFDRAMADLNQAIQLDTNNAINAFAHICRGLLYCHRKQFDRAIADFNQAIRLEPSNYLAYLNRGDTFRNLKQFDIAFADLDQAIRLNPNDSLSYTLRGVAYSDVKQFDLALADLDQAIIIDPNRASAYVNRGRVYALLNQPERAIADLNIGIRLDPDRLDPDSAFAYTTRGFAYISLMQPERAIADLDKGIILDPNNGVAYGTRGLANFMLKKTKKGCTDLKKACKLGVCEGYEFARQRGDCR